MSAYQPHYAASHLLAIGINEYSDPRFVPLGDAERDARAFAEVMSEAPYNFEVTLLLGAEATKAAVLTALSMLRKAQPDDRILFYFAGHGYTLTDNLGNQVGYLACADTIPDNPYAGLKFDEVTEIRRWAKAKHVGFVLDACFSGKALGLTRAAVPQASAEEYLQRRSWQVLTAGGDEVVSDGRSMTGTLVQTLREGIPGEKGALTFSHMGQYVKDLVASSSKHMQIPVCQYLEGSSNGEMVLYLPPAQTPMERLPQDLQGDLSSETPRLRVLAVERLNLLLNDRELGDAARSVLEDMQLDDADRDVRRRALEVLQAHASDSGAQKAARMAQAKAEQERVARESEHEQQEGRARELEAQRASGQAERAQMERLALEAEQSAAAAEVRRVMAEQAEQAQPATSIEPGGQIRAAAAPRTENLPIGRMAGIGIVVVMIVAGLGGVYLFNQSGYDVQGLVDLLGGANSPSVDNTNPESGSAPPAGGVECADQGAPLWYDLDVGYSVALRLDNVEAIYLVCFDLTGSHDYEINGIGDCPLDLILYRRDTGGLLTSAGANEGELALINWFSEDFPEGQNTLGLMVMVQVHAAPCDFEVGVFER